MKRLVGSALMLALLSGCAQKVEGEAVYRADQCRRVAIIDAETGAAVIGAEDLAFDQREDRVIISAYDRRQAEKDVRRRAFDVTEGGVYAAPLSALASDATRLVLPSIVARDTVAGGLRPHGVAFDPVNREVVFVNRAYVKTDGAWRMTPRIERAGADAAVFIGDGGAPRCSANDVAVIGDDTIVSFDHAACGWRGGLEDVVAARRSGIDAEDGAPLFDGVRFANGVAVTPGGEIALAATRDKALLLLGREAGGLSAAARYSLPGAPDNLTVNAEGAIIAALHPSLLGVGLQRRLGLGRSGSRIVSIDPETGAVDLLFEDPQAALMSAATAAVEEQGVLVIGSVVDGGLVVCRRSEDDA